MISLNNIGNYGRIGNQMFQYASLRGIAANRGFDFCIPPKDIFGINDYKSRNSDSNIHTCFDLSKYLIQLTNFKTVEEKSYKFDENIFNNLDDNTNLQGYFQSEKYFKNIENEIRNDFQFKEEVKKDCFEFIKDTSYKNQTISLHVRRGDYVGLQSYHPLPSLSYYTTAISFFDEKIPILVFSDDPIWCKEQEIFSEDRFLISENNSSEYDLCMMSLCSHHIIANSSFSWWAAWLSKSENVICPKQWFGVNLLNHDTSDLYCPGWKKI